MKPKILIVDTYYPQFLRECETQMPKELAVQERNYTNVLEWMLAKCFGTFDAYSRGLRELGWDAIDVIANSPYLQKLWLSEQKIRYDINPVPSALYVQIDHYRPDVLFMQNLSLIRPETLEALREDFILAGQLSCPWPGDEIVKQYHVLFTSFPHYLPHFTELGVHGVFLPLAFDHEVHHRLLARGVTPGERTINVAFAGGLTPQFGSRLATLQHVLRAQIPHCYFMGYGSPGDAVWGLDMYKFYGKAKIVLNIHHPAADGFSNNLRMFEATGMGAMLLTEDSPNIEDYFKPGVECMVYKSPEEAVTKIQLLLSDPPRLHDIAYAGQRRTLTHHTYFNRLPLVDQVLRDSLK